MLGKILNVVLWTMLVVAFMIGQRISPLFLEVFEEVVPSGFESWHHVESHLALLFWGLVVVIGLICGVWGKLISSTSGQETEPPGHVFLNMMLGSFMFGVVCAIVCVGLLAKFPLAFIVDITTKNNNPVAVFVVVVAMMEVSYWLCRVCRRRTTRLHVLVPLLGGAFLLHVVTTYRHAALSPVQGLLSHAGVESSPIMFLPFPSAVVTLVMLTVTASATWITFSTTTRSIVRLAVGVVTALVMAWVGTSFLGARMVISDAGTPSYLKDLQEESREKERLQAESARPKAPVVLPQSPAANAVPGSIVPKAKGQNACRSEELSLALSVMDTSLGKTYARAWALNTGSDVCYLSGQPELFVVEEGEEKALSLSNDEPPGASVVEMAPGHSAVADLSWRGRRNLEAIHGRTYVMKAVSDAATSPVTEVVTGTFREENYTAGKSFVDIAPGDEYTTTRWQP